jgi:hypothetical protein
VSFVAAAHFAHVDVGIMAGAVGRLADDQENAILAAFVDEAMAVAVILGKGGDIARMAAVPAALPSPAYWYG